MLTSRWLIAAIFALALTLWFALDNSWPSWDAAEHLRMAAQYVDLFHHPRFWEINWLHKFLSVNYYYPPGVYIFNGVLKLLLGPAVWVNELSEVIFSLILSISLYAIATILFNNRLTAALTVVFINCYPLVSVWSHTNMLDFPLLSMVCVALAALLSWQRRPSWLSAAIAGLALGLACLTKQTAIFYLFAPCLLLFIVQIYKRRFLYAAQLVYVGVIAAAMFLPWYLVNLHDIKALVTELQKNLGPRSPLAVLPSNLCYYLSRLPQDLSPILAVLALRALFFRPLYKNKLLAIPVLSTLGGMLLICALPFQLPDQRYMVPALPALALISAAFITNMLTSNVQVRIAGGVIIISLAALQFTTDNYLPSTYSTKWRKEAVGSTPIPDSYPLPPGDLWRQEWIVEKITESEKGNACWVNVMPSTRQLSVHTLQVVAGCKRSPLQFSTFRGFSWYGDRFHFSPEEIGYFNWFVITDGNQGTVLAEAASKAEYEKTIDYVEKSRHFSLYAESKLPDGSSIMLYRKL